MAQLYDKIRRPSAPNPNDSGAVTCDTGTCSVIESSNRPSNRLLHRVSNKFLDPVVEAAYQSYCAEHSYRRARLLVSGVMLIHLILSITFGFLEDTEKSGLDLLPRTYNEVGEWLQWVYLAIGVPFVVWPEKTSPLRYKWKKWVSTIIVVWVIGGQIWLTYQVSYSTEQYTSVIQKQLQCATHDPGAFDKDNYRRGMSVPDFLVRRNKNLYGAFVAVASRTGMDALVYAVAKEGYPRLAELKVIFRFHVVFIL